jgi:hypothetical protein
METKHTQGEWKVKQEDRFLLILSNNENQIADVTIPLDFRDMDFREECEANAKLIASAPDLLEALILADKLINGFIPAKSKDSLTIKNAINKATK